MAQTPQSDLCAQYIDFIRNIIFSQAFLEKFRNSKKDFTRNRKLPFAFLILFFCNLVKSSYQAELNKFFKIVNEFPVTQIFISKVALCKARKKLKYEAFIELNEQSNNFFTQNYNPKRWHGFFLKAIDGSTVKLPNFLEIVQHFGTWKPRNGEPLPMARVSQMFDPLNQITSHALIGPKSIGEREMAASHLEHLSNLDLVLLDRGYPAFWIFKLILSKGANFCSRISIQKWKVVRNFVESGKQEQIVKIDIPMTSKAFCRKFGLDFSSLTVRLIRVELESGETEVLITSLLNINQYPTHLFADLYFQRWPVEEDYKVMKCRIEIENFSGKSELSVYQDFHARIFTKNLTSILVYSTQPAVDEATKSRKFCYKTNFTHALSTIRDTIVVLLQDSTFGIQSLLSDILKTISKITEPVRPGRKFDRNHKRAQRKYCLNYKPIL